MTDLKLLIKLKKFFRKSLNKNEINFDSFIKFPLLFFRLLFFDFEQLQKNPTLRVRIGFYARMFLHRFSLLCCFVGTIQFGANAIDHSKNFDFVLRSFCNASSGVLMALKGLTIFLRKDDIQKIFVELKLLMESRNSESAKLKMKDYLDGYHQVMKVYAGIFLSVNLLIAALWLPYFINGSVNHAGVFWFPFDAFRPETFIFVQLWEEWLAYLFLSFLLAADSLLYALVTVISMEFDFLKTVLMNMKLESKNERRLRLAGMIPRHSKLLELSTKLQDIFKIIFLYSFVMSSFVICIVSFQLLISVTDSLTYMIDIVTFAVALCQHWLLCYFGQKLMDSSVEVANGIYESDWTDFEDTEFRKHLILIILQGQKANKLTAMGFVDISLKTFTSVKKKLQLFSRK